LFGHRHFSQAYLFARMNSEGAEEGSSTETQRKKLSKTYVDPSVIHDSEKMIIGGGIAWQPLYPYGLTNGYIFRSFWTSYW
jgi:hypothetical protein